MFSKLMSWNRSNADKTNMPAVKHAAGENRKFCLSALQYYYIKGENSYEIQTSPPRFPHK